MQDGSAASGEMKMDRKRNNKCRNRICACTGACFVDDGYERKARHETPT